MSVDQEPEYGLDFEELNAVTTPMNVGPGRIYTKVAFEYEGDEKAAETAAEEFYEFADSQEEPSYPASEINRMAGREIFGGGLGIEMTRNGSEIYFCNKDLAETQEIVESFFEEALEQN